jgi:type II secretory pathway pseudopilin PulG
MKNQGFTLVEFIIYIAILAPILVLITGFLLLIVLGNIKETAYREVQQNARFALTKITQEIKKANSINSPSPGPPPTNSANSLSLTMADGSLTIFDFFDGKLRITKGSSPISYDLTSDQVIVSNLKFTNLSYPDTPGTIRVEMTIDHLNPGNRREYQASINLTSSVSLVPGRIVSPSYLTQLHYRWRNDDGGE